MAVCNIGPLFGKTARAKILVVSLNTCSSCCVLRIVHFHENLMMFHFSETAPTNNSRKWYRFPFLFSLKASENAIMRKVWLTDRVPVICFSAFCCLFSFAVFMIFFAFWLIPYKDKGEWKSTMQATSKKKKKLLIALKKMLQIPLKKLNLF